MKYTTLFLLICSFSMLNVIPSVRAQAKVGKTASTQAAVRGFIWGLPPEVILENETGTYIDGQDQANTLLFVDVIRGMRSTIAYEFANNKLWRASIFVEKEYNQQQDRVNDLMKIQQDLTARFGKPVSEDLQWLDPREKNYPYSWGWAIMRGELIMTSVWQNDETEVVTYAGAKERLKPITRVTYTDRRTKQSLKQQGEINLLQAP